MQAEYEALGEVGSASEMEFDAEEEEEGEDDLQRREVPHMVHVKRVQCVRVVVLATQIEDYIRTIGLGSKSHAKSGKDRKTREKVDNKHLKENGTAEATKKEIKKEKENKKEKKKKTNAVEEGQEDRTLERQKKKNKKKKGGSNMSESGEGERGVGERAEVERQLLSLSVSTHTRLLVSPDSEQPWFDQVSPSFHCIRLCVCQNEGVSLVHRVCVCVCQNERVSLVHRVLLQRQHIQCQRQFFPTSKQ